MLVIRIIRFHGLSRMLSQLVGGRHFGPTYKIDNLPITHDTTLIAQGSQDMQGCLWHILIPGNMFSVWVRLSWLFFPLVFSLIVRLGNQLVAQVNERRFKTSLQGNCNQNLYSGTLASKGIRGMRSLFLVNTVVKKKKKKKTNVNWLKVRTLTFPKTVLSKLRERSRGWKLF